MNTPKTIQALLGGAAIALALALPANAHRMWMLPSTFTLSGEEQWVTVDAAISNDLFFPNHVPFPLSDVTVVAPDGTATPIDGGWTGEIRSSFDVHLTQQGTYKIVGGGGLLFARWTDADGEPQRARGTMDSLRERGVLDADDVALMYSGRRVETFVTLGVPTEDALAPTGEGLELEPITHPNDLYAGEEASFRMVIDGEPASGQEVTVIAGHDRYRDEVGEVTATTDEEGVFAVTFPGPGQYWLNTGLEGVTKVVDGEDLPAMMSYVATVEVLPQ